MVKGSIIYVDEWFDPFFDFLDRNRTFQWKSSFERGQFFWTYVYYSHQNLELWRPKQVDETGTRALSFDIVPAGGDAFKRFMPLVKPKLETDEEFIVIRAKRRPVILLSPPPSRIKLSEWVRYGEKVNRHLAIVIPLYSIKDKKTGKLKYSADFIESVRRLKWPQFFFIPSCLNYGIRESIAHIDSLMAMPLNHLEALPLKIAREPLNYLLDQVSYLLTQKGGQDFLALREQLLNQ